MKVAILGAGSWGTALASVFAQNGHEAVLWARSEVISTEIEQLRRNQRYLGEHLLPANLRATTSMQSAVAGSQLVLFAVTSDAIHQVLAKAKPFISKDAHVSHAIKGFDPATQQRISDILIASLNNPEKVSVISGPSHAEEVILQMPTTLVVSAYAKETAEELQDALMNRSLRVYTNPDVVGTELGGTLKNIIALGVGVADGLGFGDNAKAALMTRGLAEITRLGLVLGASRITFSGLSGVGDLIVTCTSQHSRNFRAGRLLGQGYSIEDAKSKIGMAVEGVRTTEVTHRIAERKLISMPITEAIYEILFRKKPATEAVEDLMGRARSHEIEETAESELIPVWRFS
jgi:glycerol-3-phosphate dehydrogenase (NAD(P)+)